MIDYLHGEPMKYFAPSATMTKEQYKEIIGEDYPEQPQA